MNSARSQRTQRTQMKNFPGAGNTSDHRAYSIAMRLKTFSSVWKQLRPVVSSPSHKLRLRRSLLFDNVEHQNLRTSPGTYPSKECEFNLDWPFDVKTWVYWKVMSISHTYVLNKSNANPHEKSSMASQLTASRLTERKISQRSQKNTR